MENLIKIIIYIHAFFGGIGLVAGTAVMIIKEKRIKKRKNIFDWYVSQFYSFVNHLRFPKSPQFFSFDDWHFHDLHDFHWK